MGAAEFVFWTTPSGRQPERRSTTRKEIEVALLSISAPRSMPGVVSIGRPASMRVGNGDSVVRADAIWLLALVNYRRSDQTDANSRMCCRLLCVGGVRCAIGLSPGSNGQDTSQAIGAWFGWHGRAGLSVSGVNDRRKKWQLASSLMRACPVLVGPARFSPKDDDTRRS